jgi:hypothetical protein
VSLSLRFVPSVPPLMCHPCASNSPPPHCGRNQRVVESAQQKEAEDRIDSLPFELYPPLLESGPSAALTPPPLSKGSCGRCLSARTFFDFIAASRRSKRFFGTKKETSNRVRKTSESSAASCLRAYFDSSAYLTPLRHFEPSTALVHALNI